MTTRCRILILFLFLLTIKQLSAQSVVISSYYNASEPRDEWTELLVINDNISMVNWTLRDNQTSQSSWQTAITFSNSTLWSNLRAGTIIVIWHRMIGSNSISHPVDASKQDGYIEVSANDPLYFSGGSFGSAPLFGGGTLNIAAGSGGGDILQLRDASSVSVHALSHRGTTGPDWGPITGPKLNHKASIANPEAVYICPGSALNEYGTTAPQDGTTWTAIGISGSAGLPNTCANGASQDYWRGVRQPTENPASLNAVLNGTNTQVNLTWNAVTDNNPSDGTMGYMILRSTVLSFGNPTDGHTYVIGERLGTNNDTVLALIPSSQTTNYTDNITVPCGTTYYYRIYAYRYLTDEIHGNDYHLARGRQYNEGAFGTAQVTVPGPVAPASVSSDRNNFCENDAGNITLTASGGSGTTLKWFTGSCGGTLISSTSSNTLTIPSPSVTTAYFAAWENSCGTSSCQSTTVNVVPVVPVSVSISVDENPVCAGIPVNFTATPVNPGTSPVYQWKVNGINAGSDSPTFTMTPADGDQVNVVLTSNVTCGLTNPATSNFIVMDVSSTVPLSVTVDADPGNTVCIGTSVIFTATATNGGATPVYEWFLNGNPVGTNNQTYTNVAADGDLVKCRVTSSSSCATNSPANSNTIAMTVTNQQVVSVTVDATTAGIICDGTMVTYTAHPVNGGSSPVYEWFLNGTPVGTNSQTYNHIPASTDEVWCRITSSSSCATNNPANSDTVILNVTAATVTDVSITADPGDTICTGMSVTFTALPQNGGTNPVYQWYQNGSPAGNNSPVYIVTPAGGDEIYCVLTTSLICAINPTATSSVKTIVYVDAFIPGINVSADKDSICEGTPVIFTAISDNQGSSPVYEWFVNSVSVQSGSSPTYTTNTLNGGESVTCTLTSSLPCVVTNPVSSLPFIISAAVPPVINLTDKDYLCSDSAVQLDAGDGFTSYLWQDGSTGRYLMTGSEGIYSVTAADSLGCIAYDSVLVKNCDTISPVAPDKVFVPSAFTPNGDGLNDVFRITGSPEGITSFSMQIFNRWGETVFTSTEIKQGWNGMMNNSVAPAGTYAWQIIYKASAGETRLKGVVVLVE